MNIASKLVLEAEEMVTPDTVPPGRLVDDAKFSVDHLTTLSSLADQILVLIRAEETVEILNVKDEQSWQEAPTVDNRDVSVVLDDGVVKLP
jgi:hypothetical protein